MASVIILVQCEQISLLLTSDINHVPCPLNPLPQVNIAWTIPSVPLTPPPPILVGVELSMRSWLTHALPLMTFSTLLCLNSTWVETAVSWVTLSMTTLWRTTIGSALPPQNSRKIVLLRYRWETSGKSPCWTTLRSTNLRSCLRECPALKPSGPNPSPSSYLTKFSRLLANSEDGLAAVGSWGPAGGEMAERLSSSLKSCPKTTARFNRRCKSWRRSWGRPRSCKVRRESPAMNIGLVVSAALACDLWIATSPWFCGR